MPIENRKLYAEIRKSVAIGYQIFLPAGYEENLDKSWPLILFLHGIKKRGDDLQLLDNYGLTWIADRKKDFPFIVLTPQCPSLSLWPLERDAVLALMDEIICTHRVDSERVYLTGFSMGGHGAWDLAAYAAERFAAVAPLAGWYYEENAVMLKDMPIWTFHGEEDDVVPVSRSRIMADAIEALEGNIKFTAYPGLNHFIMDETYGNPELYQWMLIHKRK